MLAQPLYKFVRGSDVLVIGVLLATIAILATARSAHYLLFHTMAELFSIVVSFSIFVLTWTSSRYLVNGYLIVLGGSYGAIGLIDVFHTLTFRGMNLFPGVSTNYPTQFWLIARYLEALALLFGPLVVSKRPNFYYVGAGFMVIALVAAGAVVNQWFPATFIDGVGLTPFKVYSEYVIIAMLIVGFILLYRHRSHFESRIFFLLVGSLWLAVATEFCFTRYGNFYDFTNELGHYFRFVSVSLAFLAVVLSGVQQPLDLIFREMETHRNMLDELNKKLIESDDRLNRAQAVAGVGSWYLDIATNVLTWSDETYRLFGQQVGTPQTFETFASHIHPDDLPSVFAAWENALQGNVYDIEHRIVVGDQIRWVREIAEVTFAADGRPLAGLGTVQDITERKKVDQQQRIAATAFEAQEGMVVTDANSIILRVNQAFTEITGYSAEEVLGETPRILKSGRHDSAFYSAMWASIKTAGAWQGEIWNRRKDGEVYPEWLTITAVSGDAGEISNYVATLTDITLRKAAADEIEHLAFYDSLTKLPNRRLLLDRLNQALVSSARSKRQGSLFFIDLDNFKILNDTLGHDKGDQLLEQVAQRLVTCVREGDTVARLGGDEFVVMLTDLSENLEEAGAQTETVGEKILDTLNQPYQLGGVEHLSTPSIGVTLFRSPHKSEDELLKRADLAMYQAKAAGRNTLRFFDPEMQTAVTARASLEADLRQAVRANQFVLYYQAQMSDTGQLTGAEALVRWQHPERGLVAPVEFIPLAEETGLIVPLGHWVLNAACDQLVAWAANPDSASLTLAVNVSSRQFRHPDFVDQVAAVLDHSGADPHRLKLELTESLLLDDVEDTIAKMTSLRARGVGFALDDFGTGYSSLAYLKRLPLDQLKIDQSFVRDVLTDPNDAAIARTVVALAKSLGLGVIAEGVETEAQRDFLATSGCFSYQGFFFNRPAPIAQFDQFVQRTKAMPGTA